MARRARKTPLEKYQEELLEVSATIEQYESCLETMREKKEQLENQILLQRGQRTAGRTEHVPG
jgi:chromosome segregation ATPase